MYYRVKILRIARDKTQLNEIKIKKMKNQKGQNRGSCPDHKPGEEGSLGFVPACVANRTCKPVLYLQKDTP